MIPRPQPRPLSEHAEIMEQVFKWLEDSDDRDFLGLPDHTWNEETAEVLAALDAFADEQRESA